MTAAGWRTIALLLAAICVFQLWRGCTREVPAPVESAAADCRPTPPAPSRDHAVTRAPELPAARADSDDAAGKPSRSFHGFKIPAWVMHFAPQPGEKLRDYRDRMLPLAQAAIAPQRARVARTRDDFATLDPHQRAELDSAVQEAASAIQDRVMSGILSGELRPATFKPMTGVTMAREILDIIERGNTRFSNTLTPDQRTRMASHHFDFADYLLFSAHWEDALHVLD